MDLSDGKLDSCAHVRVVPDVTELCEFFCSSNWEDVAPPSFVFSKKRTHRCTSTQEEIRYEGSQGNPQLCKIRTPPLKGSRRVTKWKARDGVRRKERSWRGQDNFLKESKV